MWDEPIIARLVTAYRAGGRRAAIDAFPELRPAQVLTAIRRYVDAPSGEPRPLISRSAVRAAIAAMPYELFVERMTGLLGWSPLRGSHPDADH